MQGSQTNACSILCHAHFGILQPCQFLLCFPSTVEPILRVLHVNLLIIEIPRIALVLVRNPDIVTSGTYATCGSPPSNASYLNIALDTFSCHIYPIDILLFSFLRTQASYPWNQSNVGGFYINNLHLRSRCSIHQGYCGCAPVEVESHII